MMNVCIFTFTPCNTHLPACTVINHVQIYIFLL